MTINMLGRILICAALVGAAQAGDAPVQPATDTANAQPADQANVAKQDQPFEPPPGFRKRTIKGEEYFCKKEVILGSRFPKEICLTRDGIKELEERGELMREEMRQNATKCGSAVGACYTT
ncbi:MAG: hypothetical protein R3E77_02630 [Steroidobacteraceae bacterium]